MKPLFTAIIFVLFSLTGLAQKIHFSDTGNIWRTFSDNGGNVPHHEWFINYQSGGDTVLAGVVYRKVYRDYYGAVPKFYTREDTIQKKVYLKTYTSQTADTTEKILYNYALLPGDTVQVNYPNFQATYHVASLDSVLIGNLYYKVWDMVKNQFSSMDAVSEYYVVEGIGCLTDPEYPIHPDFFEVSERLTCFHNRGQSLPLNPKAAGFDNATSCAFTAVKDLQQHNTTSVYPNPANNTSIIELKQPITNGQLDLYDMLGRTIYHTAVNDQTKIPVGKYMPVSGQYFYKITDSGKGQVFTGKFIFE